MLKLWQKDPWNFGVVAGFLVFPLLWALQMIVLRLVQGMPLPLISNFSRIAVLGGMEGAILGMGISVAASQYHDGERKRAQLHLVICGGIVLLVSMRLLWTLIPFVSSSRHPMLSGMLHIPPALLPFIDPRYSWNFPFHCALLMLCAGLLMRTRR